MHWSPYPPMRALPILTMDKRKIYSHIHNFASRIAHSSNMRSSTFVAAFASLAAATLTLAAGQQQSSGDTLRILSSNGNENLIKRDNLVSAPARSRHATRDHRSHARNLRNSASKPSSSLKKRKSSRCKASSSSRVANLDDGKKMLSEVSSSSSSSSSSESSDSSNSSNDSTTTGTIEDQKTTSSGGGLGDLDIDSASSFLKIGSIYAGFLPGKHFSFSFLPVLL